MVNPRHVKAELKRPKSGAVALSVKRKSGAVVKNRLQLPAILDFKMRVPQPLPDLRHGAQPTRLREATSHIANDATNS